MKHLSEVEIEAEEAEFHHFTWYREENMFDLEEDDWCNDEWFFILWAPGTVVAILLIVLFLIYVV
jgi:hypothetical protein